MADILNFLNFAIKRRRRRKKKRVIEVSKNLQFWKLDIFKEKLQKKYFFNGRIKRRQTKAFSIKFCILICFG